MLKKKIICLLVAIMMIASLSGCANEKATITTTVYPVKYLVEAIAGDKVDVEYISTDDFIQRATLVDDYDEILSRTTLLLYIGSLEPYFDVHEEVFENYQFEKIDLANLSAIDGFKRYTIVNADGVNVVRESDYYVSDLFALTDVYKKDPFIWIDPIAMSSMAATIKEWLQDYYPENTLVFENNFKELQSTLVRMDAEYQTLKSMSDVKIASVTATFGNWQKQYGVQVYPLVLSKYGVLPTDEQLEFIENAIKDNKVKYIVLDETLPEDMQQLYQKVKEDLKLEEIKLSSLSRLSEDDFEMGKDYITIMYENLTALEKAFK